MNDSITQPLVLVVDDDPSVLDALGSLLSPRLEPVYRVEMATSGEEALALVESRAESPVALVISDEKMPGMSGNDLLVALRQRAVHQNGGRILVTAYAGLASAKRAINEAEVDKYYPKPWDAEGALLPAVAEILERFARKSGLDSFLLARRADGKEEMGEVLALRREWWGFLTFMDEIPAEEDREAASFADAADGGADHFLAWRISPRERRAAGAIRLRRGADGKDAAVLDSLAFLPEEAGDEVERLLLRSAVLHAGASGVASVLTDAPLLRREVYEAVGFRAGEPSETEAGGLRMHVSPGGVGSAFASRWAREHRLCSCLQAGCTSKDYAGERRGYFCPLDALEGRIPAGFPRAQGA